MRRLLFSLLAMSLCGMVVGCHSTCTHGVCDCEVEDPCVNRAPWVAAGGHVGEVGIPVAPMPSATESRTNALPPGKKL